MRWWHELKFLIRKLNRRRAEKELEEEIRVHLQLETQEQIEADFRRVHTHLPVDRQLVEPQTLLTEARVILRDRFLAAVRCSGLIPAGRGFASSPRHDATPRPRGRQVAANAADCCA